LATQRDYALQRVIVKALATEHSFGAVLETNAAPYDGVALQTGIGVLSKDENNEARWMLADDALLFLRVAETRSFKEAARQLRVSQSHVSKRIAQLELQLGTALIYRSSRSISLTAPGETLLDHCRLICDLAQEAKMAVEELSGSPTGRLRFSVPTCLGAALLPRLIDDFAVHHPAVALEAHSSEAFVDIVAGSYDVVIRIAQRLTDSNLTAQRLRTSPLVLAASPEYLDKQGTPSHVRELSHHSCLGLRRTAGSDAVWRFRAPDGSVNVPVRLASSTETNLALVLIACRGLGFVYVPEIVIANELRQGWLRPVLSEFCEGIEWGIYAVHSGRKPAASVRAFIEFVKDFLPKLADIDRWALHAQRSRTSARRKGARTTVRTRHSAPS
jgi:DNA-binding transcriptional LysR family regulator